MEQEQTERRPNYVSVTDRADIQRRLTDMQSALGELAADMVAIRESGEKFPLDVARWILGTLRDMGLRTGEIHAHLLHATDPWTPGIPWSQEYIRLAGLIGAAEMLLAPDVSAVLSVDASQANTLDDALDAVETNVARYRRHLAASRSGELRAVVAERAEGWPACTPTSYLP